MRIQVILFSIYLLALSVLPCSDTLRGFSPDTQHRVTASTDHHAESSDICSPFCICNCCGSPVTSKFRAFVAMIIKPQIMVARAFPMRKITFISAHTVNIWHPPQTTV